MIRGQCLWTMRNSLSTNESVWKLKTQYFLVLKLPLKVWTIITTIPNGNNINRYLRNVKTEFYLKNKIKKKLNTFFLSLSFLFFLLPWSSLKLQEICCFGRNIFRLPGHPQHQDLARREKTFLWAKYYTDGDLLPQKPVSKLTTSTINAGKLCFPSQWYRIMKV